jgi:hypothetical protein
MRVTRLDAAIAGRKVIYKGSGQIGGPKSKFGQAFEKAAAQYGSEKITYCIGAKKRYRSEGFDWAIVFRACGKAE